MKIKVKWKEGFGLLVFLILSGFYFFGIPDFFAILDYKYVHYYEDLISFFFRIVLLAPFLVSVFLFSIYKTEKRITEGRFSFWKLFIFSLITSLIFGFLWEVLFGFLSVYDYGGSNAVKKLSSALFWRFHIFPAVMVFVFYLAPSFIFYVSKGNIKKFHIGVVVLFLFIFAGLFGYKQISALTCDLNYDGYCVGESALRLKEPSLCEKVKTTKEFSNYYNYGENSCYVAMSKKWKEVSLCDNIKTTSKETKNPSYDYGQYQIYECINNIAKNIGNKKICEKVSVLKYRERCYYGFDKNIESGLNDWKTYKNEKYGFEFKYPKAYYISLPSSTIVDEATGGFDFDPQQELLNKDILTSSDNKEIIVWIYEFSSLTKTNKKACEEVGSLVVDNDCASRSLTQEDLIIERKEIENNKKNNTEYALKNNTNVSKIIKTNNLKVKREIYYSYQSGQYNNLLVFFTGNGDNVEISSGIKNTNTIEEALKSADTVIFDKIIATLKFLE